MRERFSRRRIKPERVAPPLRYRFGKAPSKNLFSIFRKGYIPTQVSSDPAKGSSLPAPSPEYHLLSRISFGVTKETMASINSMGAGAYLEKQLDYKSISDNATENYVKKHFPSMRKDVTSLLLKGDWEVGTEVQQTTTYRANFSNRQLLEVMADFWNTHFSIYIWDDYTPWLKVEDERSVIRPHALGKFPDMLEASSKSTAMLTYLDNHYNYKDGPNENYARELLELHTMGVDNGYTQKDVEELARCLTGWGLEWRRKKYGQFRFYKDYHDDKAKKVLGIKIPAKGGIKDGEKVVEMLAEHPSTAWYISFKLCRRFVSDSPSDKLVNEIADIYKSTGGDIKDMLRGIFSSTEFKNSVDQKVKRPFEYATSLMRVLDPGRNKYADSGMNWYLYRLGQAPFEWAPPDGYPDTARDWIHTSGLLNRWNFALHLAQGYLWGIKPVADKYLKKMDKHTPRVYVDTLVEELMFREMTEADKSKILEFAADGKSPNKKIVDWMRQETIQGIIALILSSAYYQYR